MKKLLSYLLILAITLGVMPSLVACEEEPEGPIYSEEYLYNDDYHWLPQLNGDGMKDYGEHYNPTGTCYFPPSLLSWIKFTMFWGKYYGTS